VKESPVVLQRKKLRWKLRCSVGAKLRKTTASNQLKKGGENSYMRLIAIIVLATAAIGLSACAHKEAPATSTATHSSYSK
jgi:hypothetical protein